MRLLTARRDPSGSTLLRCLQGANGTAAAVPGKRENALRDPRFKAPVVSLHTTEDGACSDEMNRNLWQVRGGGDARGKDSSLHPPFMAAFIVHGVVDRSGRFWTANT